MRKTLFTLLLLFSVSVTVFAQENISEKKYDYIILLQKYWETPRTLEILYSDGHTEKFATLAGNDSGENLNKNLATLLKAFNFLGSKGYELVDQPCTNDSKTYFKWQYTFKRQL